VKLVGTKSNRNGIGAVVRVTSGGEKQWQMLRSGSSYLSQSELALTFGLGSAAKEDSIEVQWPSGQVDRASAIAGEQTVTVEEGKGVVTSRAYGKGSPAAGERGMRGVPSARPAIARRKSRCLHLWARRRNDNIDEYFSRCVATRFFE